MLIMLEYTRYIFDIGSILNMKLKNERIVNGTAAWRYEVVKIYET